MSRRSEHTTKVFVGSLPPNVTADDLRALFNPYGSIAECDIANRCGFLHLEDKDLADKAIEELNNTNFMGGRISVEKGRVKPRGERRGMRPPGGGGGGRGGGGGMGGRKRDSGPYSREGGYGRPPPRNGNYGRDEYNSYGDYRADYGRSYEDGYDRRPMYDDRRGGGYMGEPGSYNNGYDRRPYGDDRAPYSEVPRGYDDRRMPPNSQGGYDDRRPPMAERRPLIDDQSGLNQRAPMNSYDRAPPPNDMYSRRDATAKPMTGGYDRSAPSTYGSYGTTATATNYGMPAANTTGYGVASTGAYTQPPATGYGDTRTPSTGYMDNRQQAAPVATGYATSPATGYSTTQSGGYGDNYGVRAPANTYDTSYPPLPQQQRGW